MQLSHFFFDQTRYKAQLNNEIVQAYNKLILSLEKIAEDITSTKQIDFIAGPVSIRDVIAYQIGWGSLLLYWYNSGIQNTVVEMPGAGFTKWDYAGLARYFYHEYYGTSLSDQLRLFQSIVMQIIAFVEKEYESGNLNALGIWKWCTLPSGKKWPLSKWVQVNTVAPYTRTTKLIKALRKTMPVEL